MTSPGAHTARLQPRTALGMLLAGAPAATSTIMVNAWRTSAVDLPLRSICRVEPQVR